MNVLDGAGGYDGKVTPRYLQRVVNRLVKFITDSTSSADSRPYKVYTALLSQTGTSAPVATVIENTFGGALTWSRKDVGEYIVTRTGAFTADKTVCFNSGLTSTAAGQFIRGGNNTCVFLSGLDDEIANMSIEIRVYN